MNELIWPIINFLVLISVALWKGIPFLRQYFKNYSKRISQEYKQATENFNLQKENFEKIQSKNNNSESEVEKIFDEVKQEKSLLENKHKEDVKLLLQQLDEEAKRSFEAQSALAQRKLLEETLESVVTKANTLVKVDENLKKKTSSVLVEKID